MLPVYLNIVDVVCLSRTLIRVDQSELTAGNAHSLRRQSHLRRQNAVADTNIRSVLSAVRPQEAKAAKKPTEAVDQKPFGPGVLKWARNMTISDH